MRLARSRFDAGAATQLDVLQARLEAEDPDRAYRERAAYVYFLRRGLDLLVDAL